MEVHTRPRHACMPAASRTTGQSVDKLLAFRTVHVAHALLRVVHLSRKSGAWYPGKRITARQMPSCDLTWSTAARPPQPVENVSAIAEGGVKHRWRTPELFYSCSQAKGQHRQPRTHLPGRPACAPRRGWVSSSGAPALPCVVDTRSRHACWPAALRAAAQSVDKLLSFHTVNAVHALLRVACLLRKPGGW